ncbi:MAG: autotransporter assembly complex family protein [Ectothiorhodospiraceae bacterium]
MWAGAEIRLQIDGVKDRIEQNVRAYAGDPPTRESAESVRAYSNRVRGEARRALESLGYYNADIRVERSHEEDTWTVRVRIDAGEPVRVRKLHVEIRGEGSDDKWFRQVVEQIPLREGGPFDHGRYESSKNALRTVALNRGYFDFSYPVHRVEVDAEANTADVNLVFDTGPRYTFGNVTFSRTPFNDQLLRRMQTYQAGDPYSADLVGEFNRRLLDSGYFADVRVNTDREQASDRRIPTRVDLTPREPNSIGLGAGYSTDEGPRGRISWDRHYLNARGHSLHSEIRVSRVRQNAASRYVIPLRDPINDQLEFNVGWEREDYDDTFSQRLTAGVQRRQEFDTGWRRTQSLRWLQERFQQGDDEGKTTLVLPGLAFERTRSRGGNDPYWGDRQSYSVEVADEHLFSDLNLARAIASQKWLRRFGERHRGLIRLEVGAIATNDFPNVPSSLRFFAGGDQSVRGYEYRSLAPRNDAGELLGGRYLTTGSVEYDYEFIPKWRFALFTDAGNAYDDLAEPLKVGSGFGIHWVSPVGPIRLDLAWAVSEPGNPFRFHISMGPPL